MLRHMLYQMQNITNHLELMIAFDQPPHVIVTVEPLFVRPTYLKPVQLQVPAAFVRNGQITLNVSADAVRNLEMDHENGIITFNSHFQGVAQRVVLPMEHIIVVRNSPKIEMYGFSYENAPEHEYWLAILNPYFKEPEKVEPVKPAGRPTLKIV